MSRTHEKHQIMSRAHEKHQTIFFWQHQYERILRQQKKENSKIYGKKQVIISDYLSRFSHQIQLKYHKLTALTLIKNSPIPRGLEQFHLQNCLSLFPLSKQYSLTSTRKTSQSKRMVCTVTILISNENNNVANNT